MVHSQVGDTCVGAKVNGKVMPLRQHLSNGDQVEVITARGGKPNPDWLKFVATGRARARIRRFAQAAERETHRQEGRAAVAKAFRQDGLDFSEKLLEPALKTLKQTSTEELFVAVGSGALGPREVLFAAVPKSLSTSDTFQSLLQLFAWSMRCMVAGAWPTARHDLTPFGDRDKARRARAGQPFRFVGALLQVRADWDWLKKVLKFPGWGDRQICWRCHASNRRSNLHSMCWWLLCRR
jgi:hypothetical protein